VEVAAKVIDGEAIIMNLSNGLYFSMDNVGALVWELVEAGQSLEEMTDLVGERFDADREAVRRDITRLVTELLSEDLVQVSEDPPGGAPTVSLSGDGLEYAPPVLNKYSDMADLLALDPPMPGLGDTPD
jgi:hypothetical protein